MPDTTARQGGALPRRFTNYDEAMAYSRRIRQAGYDAAIEQAVPDTPAHENHAVPPSTPQTARRPLRPPRSPERQKRLNRKRRLAASGPLPPALAARYTEGERAVLRIVGDDCRDKGRCTDTIKEIAARAGVRRTTAQNTLRKARKPEEGEPRLIHVRERRRHGENSLTNVITIVSGEWRLWLTKGGGFKKSSTTESVPVQKCSNAGPMGIGALWERYSQPYDPGSRNDPRWYRKKEADGAGRADSIPSKEVSGSARKE